MPRSLKNLVENIIVRFSMPEYAIKHKSSNCLEIPSGRLSNESSFVICAAFEVRVLMCLRIRRRHSKVYSCVIVSGSTEK